MKWEYKMVDSKGISAAQSIVGVMNLVSGVAKRDRNDAQRFNFRGIDAVVNAIGPALREVGGVIVPTVLKKKYDRGVTKSGTPTVECFLTIAFDWHGTDGGEPIRGVVAAEAMDTSDKATAKAMSVGLRTYLLQTLMLPTDEKDPDADYIERKTVVPDVSVPPNFRESVDDATSLDDLKILWDEAVAGGFSKQVQALISDRKKVLS
jgi:hypothetical protein